MADSIELGLLRKQVADLHTQVGRGPLDKSPPPPNPPGMDDAWRTKVDDRLGRLENEVHAIKGGMDWMKVAFSLLGGVVAILAAAIWQVSAKVDAIVPQMRAEFRDDFRKAHDDTMAQVSAIANAIIAVKQQAPQVILVPPPTEQKKP